MYKTKLTNWQESQNLPVRNFYKILKDRIEKSNQRCELTIEEIIKQIVRLEVMYINRNRVVQKRTIHS